MSSASDDREPVDEHQVTPLELFFDLSMAFALTQVTARLVHSPSWVNVLESTLVLAAIWFAWNAYSWFTSALDVDEGGVRLTMLAATGTMFFVALAVPGAFGESALLFGCAYATLRVLHVVLSATIARGDPTRRGALIRFLPTTIASSSLLVLAAFVAGDTRVVLWVIAVAVDYLGLVVVGIGGGWHVAARHYAERHRLIILIALGESIIAIGIGAGRDPGAAVLVTAALGIVLVSALWWLYFDVAAIFAEQRLVEATGVLRAKLARDSYTYLHLPLVVGIVLLAFGVETTLHDVGDPLGSVPAVALFGGTALYLFGHIAFLYRATHYVFRRRTIGAAVLLALIPTGLAVPALASLALVASICMLIVAYEAIRYRTTRVRLRHPDQER